MRPVSELGILLGVPDEENQKISSQEDWRQK